MLRFEHPDILYGLGLIALLAAATVYRWRQLRRRRGALADAGLLDVLTDGASFRRRRTRWLLALAALGCWVVALANPQYGFRTRVAEVRSTELVVALDISESMRTEDVRPSRLARAQNFLLDLLDELDGERVGLVLFAGQAYLQMPLSTDYGAAKLLIRSANPSQAPTQGTSFASAIALAERVLAPDEGQTPVRRLVVLVSDGENNEPLAESALETAADGGLRLFAVGVGTEAGGNIPLPGSVRGGLKRDRGGEVVVSKFDPTALQTLAEVGNGRYYDLNANTIGVAQSIARAVADGDTGGTDEEVFREAASYYQLPALLGLGLWLAAWLVGVQWPPRPAGAITPGRSPG